ncbi:hypothetical protein L1987_05986 [Smallanthus sonchifolius]|uniref:Uncharacterized protein n=1 Tax=Smallanthus sonchifolius TaxID=185202 RepID=A0ACB9JWW2_9ASTR|nr:hypothetical protein L1987_05986 [Smallanthus sonchifolius]
MAARRAKFMLLLTLSFVILLRFAESVVPQQEVEAVGNFLAAMNATSWRFNGDYCNLDIVSEVQMISQEANASIGCDCNIGNDTDCHVIRITHKFYSVDGVLSPELVKLPYLRSFSLLGNRLTGEIPRALGNISTLRRLRINACSLHVNCGGNDLTIMESNGQSVLYEGDANVDGGAARLYKAARNLGFSSTGDFMDDNIYQNTRYIESLQGNTSLPALYTTARLSPLTLTYFSYCLENGEYSVKLHFAKIQFTNDTTYRSLGRRIFDIYIQGRRVRRDFNIEDEAGGVRRPMVMPFNASVTDNILEIRFNWAGIGTTQFPKRGAYGPLVSAIDVDSYFKSCSAGGKRSSKVVYIGIGIGVPLLVLLILGTLSDGTVVVLSLMNLVMDTWHRSLPIGNKKTIQEIFDERNDQQRRRNRRESSDSVHERFSIDETDNVEDERGRKLQW